MNTKTTYHISKNERVVVTPDPESPRYPFRIRVEKETTTTVHCDYPVKYEDGRIAYDWPEIISWKAKILVSNIFMEAECGT